MTAQILKGAEVVEALNNQITADVEELKEKGITPTLAIVRVGERGDDIAYEHGATRRAAKLGVEVQSIVLASNAEQAELAGVIERLNEDEGVHGVLMFRPLPAQFDEDEVRNLLNPQKDIDGITDLSLAGVFTGNALGYPPCTAQACIEILDYFGIEISGKEVAVVGRSLVIGKPVSMMLLGRNATVTMAHSRTKDLRQTTQKADIVIACVGKAQMLDASYFTSQQTVIDVGINVTEERSLVGDVNTDEAKEIVSAITPVPGGVGTVTTSVLIKQVVSAAKKLAR